MLLSNVSICWRTSVNHKLRVISLVPMKRRTNWRRLMKLTIAFLITLRMIESMQLLLLARGGREKPLYRRPIESEA